MKRGYLRIAVITALMSMFATNVSAQFWKKLESAVSKVEDASKKVDDVTRQIDDVSNQLSPRDEENGEQARNSISTEDFLKNVPYYTVKKVIETDTEGNPVKNEDGTIKYTFQLIDKDGNVGDRNTAKKHLNSALKSGAIILAKVGGGATAGALIGKKVGKSKKNAWIGAGIGAAVGLIGSAGDIKKVKEQVKLLKDCKRTLSLYEKTFTEEGTPIDATVDLTNVDGFNFMACEEISKTSEDIKKELLASKQAGDAMGNESLEDVEIPDDLLG